MDNRSVLQGYVNDFRRHMARFLAPGVGLACTVFPSLGPGAIVEFTIGPKLTNLETYKPAAATVNEALSQIQQRSFGGNLNSYKFGGTNTLVEQNRIILLKGEDDLVHWGDSAAQDDVKRIVERFQRPSRHVGVPP